MEVVLMQSKTTKLRIHTLLFCLVSIITMFLLLQLQDVIIKKTRQII